MARGELSVLMTEPMDMKNLCKREYVSMLVYDGPPQLAAYPKVAPEPSIYWPRVRITPFGPAPKRIMLVAPGRS